MDEYEQLRVEFAKAALQGKMAAGEEVCIDGYAKLAAKCFAAADAMVDHLKKERKTAMAASHGFTRAFIQPAH